MENKGWVVEGLDYEAPTKPNYDISEDNISSDGTPFVEDVSKWRAEIYNNDKYNLEITSIPYNSSEQVGEMWGSEGTDE